MNSAGSNLFVMYMFLFFGVILLISGIKTIISKSFFSVSRRIYPQSWRKPVLITGKKAVSIGVSNTIIGIAFIALFVAIYNEVN